jgi:hypothetical protein
MMTLMSACVSATPRFLLMKRKRRSASSRATVAFSQLIDLRKNGLNLQPIGAFLMGALRLADKPRLRAFLEWHDLKDDSAFTLPAVIASLAPLCGAAAIVLEDGARARSLTEKAVADCQKVRHRPELALSKLQLAELLLDHYPDEHNAAIDELDFAISEFREMKM